MASAPVKASPPTSRSGEWTIWVVQHPNLGARSLEIEWEGDRHEIGWDAVEYAYAAEVGEPEGIRAVVFDLLWPSGPSGGGGDAVILRFSVDPCDGPKQPAQRIVETLGESRCSNSLQSLSRDGRATDCFSHLDFLDQALLQALAARR